MEAWKRQEEKKMEVQIFNKSVYSLLAQHVQLLLWHCGVEGLEEL